MSRKPRAITPEPATPMSFTLQNFEVDDFASDQSVLRKRDLKGKGGLIGLVGHGIDALF